MSTSKPEAAAGGQQLQKYQTEMLGKLRALRDSLESERAPFMKMQAERDQAVAAKKEVNAQRVVMRGSLKSRCSNLTFFDVQLEEANEKMAYRIKHLIRAIDPEFAANQVRGEIVLSPSAFVLFYLVL